MLKKLFIIPAVLTGIFSLNLCQAGTSLSHDQYVHKAPLDENILPTNPIPLVQTWIDDEQKTAVNNAYVGKHSLMTLSTASLKGEVSGRTVALASFDEKGFYFTTQKNSLKMNDIRENPQAALTFLFGSQQRQIRVTGTTRILSSEEAAQYFNALPREHQITKYLDLTDKTLPNRQALDRAYEQKKNELQEKKLPLPENLCVVCVIPEKVEFLQDMQNGLQDRIEYVSSGNASWIKRRVGP